MASKYSILISICPLVLFLCLNPDITLAQITYPTPTDFKNFLTNDPYDSYNKNIFPRVNQADNVTVTIQFYLIAITSFDEVNGQIKTVGYYDISWENQLLTWTTTQSSMDNMLIGQDNFWRPNIVMQNSVDKLEEIGSKYYRIRIEKNGTHEWLVGAISKTACTVDVTYYPFDRQTCSIILTSWGYTPKQVVLTSDFSTIDLVHYEKSLEWDLESTSVESDLSGNAPKISFKLHLKRKPAFFIVNMVVPILILGMLNSFVFLLPQESGERVGYAITAFLTFAVFLTMVSDGLPKTSSPMSQLSYFLAIMMTISSVTTFLTILTLRIFHMDENTRPPRWLRLFVAFFLCDTCRKYCCKSKEEKEKIKEREKKRRKREKELRKKKKNKEEIQVQNLDDEDEEEEEYDEDGYKIDKDYTKHIDWKLTAQTIDVLLFFVFTAGSSCVCYFFLGPLFNYASL